MSQAGDVISRFQRLASPSVYIRKFVKVNVDSFNIQDLFPSRFDGMCRDFMAIKIDAMCVLHAARCKTAPLDRMIFRLIMSTTFLRRVVEISVCCKKSHSECMFMC